MIRDLSQSSFFEITIRNLSNLGSLMGQSYLQADVAAASDGPMAVESGR